MAIRDFFLRQLGGSENCLGTRMSQGRLPSLRMIVGITNDIETLAVAFARSGLSPPNYYLSKYDLDSVPSRTELYRTQRALRRLKFYHDTFQTLDPDYNEIDFILTFCGPDRFFDSLHGWEREKMRCVY